MTTGDWGTRPKIGAPADFQLTRDGFAVWLEPLNLPSGLLALVLGSLPWYTKTVTTADLCSTPPAEGETFTLDDMWRTLGVDTNLEAWAKVERLARARLWRTYCEYVPPPPPADASGWVDFMYQKGGDGPFEGSNWLVPWSNYDAAYGNLYVVVYHCLSQSSDSTPCQLLARGVGYTDEWFALGTCPWTAGQSNVNAIPAGTYLQLRDGVNFGHVAGHANWEPDLSRDWALWQPPGGEWYVQLLVYQLGTPPPLAPSPWQLGPVEMQFTPECVDALCTMADQWQGVRLPVLGLDTRLNHIEDLIGDIVLTPPAQLTTHVETMAGGTISGNGEGSVPARCIGVVFQITRGPESGEFGAGPLTYFPDAGFVAAGTANGWLRQERLQHDTYLLQLPDKGTRIGWDLRMGTSCSLTFLVVADDPPPPPP